MTGNEAGPLLMMVGGLFKVAGAATLIAVERKQVPRGSLEATGEALRAAQLRPHPEDRDFDELLSKLDQLPPTPPL